MDEQSLIEKYFEGCLTHDEAETMAAMRRKSPDLDRRIRLLDSLRNEPLPGLPDDPNWDTAVVRRARLRQIEAAPTWRQRLFHLFWAPRPVFAVALLGVVAAIFGAAHLKGASPVRGSTVAFILVQPGARSVSVAGDFNAWEPGVLRLQKVDGVWRGEASLPPGVYQYQFIVDGDQWMADPAAAGKAEDGFGRVNSVMRVGSGQQSL